MRENIAKIGKLLDRLTYITSNVSLYLCVAALVAGVVLYGVYILGRAFLPFPLGWIFVEEVTEYWVLFLAVFAASYTLRTGKHVDIDIVTSHLPEKVRNVLTVITTLVALVIACYIVKQGVIGALYGLRVGIRSVGPLNMLLWPVYTFIPIGFVLLSFELLNHLCQSIVRLTKGK
jgi:TRAP-type C4-dicarboxylate transport system permease small subunit